MAGSTTTGASVLSPEDVRNIVTVPLQKASVILNSGVNIIDSHGPVRIPTYTGHTSPVWHGENELITETEPSFGEVLLLDPRIKSVKSLHRFSNELARQSIVETVTAIQDRMVADTAGKLDDTFIAGNGAVVGVSVRSRSAFCRCPVCSRWPRWVSPRSTLSTTLRVWRWVPRSIPRSSRGSCIRVIS